MSSNKNIKDNMIRKYGKKCFIEELGLRTRDEIEQDLKKYNKSKRKELMALTFHHIRERRAGGAASEENGAILRNINHIWFNRLPKKEQARINKLFQEYKCKCMREDRHTTSKNNMNHYSESESKSEAKAFRESLKVINKTKSEQDADINKNNINYYSEEDYKKYIKARRARQKEKWQECMRNRSDEVVIE